MKITISLNDDNTTRIDINRASFPSEPLKFQVDSIKAAYYAIEKEYLKYVKRYMAEVGHTQAAREFGADFVRRADVERV